MNISMIFRSILILFSTLFIFLNEHDCHTLKSRFLRITDATSNNTRRVPRRLIAAEVKSSPPLEGVILIGSAGNKSFYTDPDKLGLQWSEALDFCHELGLQPASVETLSEHKIVRNFLGKLPHRFFWLSGTDYFNEGHWKWLRTGENFRFQRWAQGFPSKNRKTNCLYLSYGNDGWIDSSCSSNKLIIRPLCQKMV